MNLVTMRTRVKRKLGLGDADATVSPAVLTDSINEAIQSISTEMDWPWLYKEATGSTTPLSPFIALPADLTRVVFLSVNGLPLDAEGQKDLAQWRTDDSGAAITGQPTAYTEAGANFRLYPVPGSGTSYPYILAYYAAETELVADTDSPLLPVPYQGWIITRAAKLVAVRTDNKSRLTALEVEDTKWQSRVMDNVHRSDRLPGITKTKPSIWQPI